MHKGLAATTQELSVDELVGLVLECGKFGVNAMALLDKANTESYGNPEITEGGTIPWVVIFGVMFLFVFGLIWIAGTSLTLRGQCAMKETNGKRRARR